MGHTMGSCLCGSITYQIDGEPAFVAACHCLDCQKQTGTSFSPVAVIKESQLSTQGNTAVYTTIGNSGQKVHGHFYRDCGSPIYSQLEAQPGMLAMKAGAFDDTSALTLQAEIYCETAQSWLSLAGGWPKFPRSRPA